MKASSAEVHLRSLEGVHDSNGGDKPHDVGNESGGEVQAASRLAAGTAARHNREKRHGKRGVTRADLWNAPTFMQASTIPAVEAEQQRNDDAGQDNVAQAQHGVVGAVDAIDQEVPGEKHCMQASQSSTPSTLAHPSAASQRNRAR